MGGSRHNDRPLRWWQLIALLAGFLAFLAVLAIGIPGVLVALAVPHGL